ncbi:MAG: Ig-like domain-containing protein [Limisphaerales bacterium]
MRRQVQARRLAAGLEHAQFTATVSGASGCDVAGVEFYAGAVRLASLTSPPYSFDWNNVPVGTHVVTAISTDAGARVALSEPLTFRVNAPPTISLTSPPAGASYNRPVNITISATAADTDGTVSRVDFYANGVLIGTDTTAPYSIVWGNAPAGIHSLTATATDNNSGQTTSTARSITVN